MPNDALLFVISGILGRIAGSKIVFTTHGIHETADFVYGRMTLVTSRIVKWFVRFFYFGVASFANLSHNHVIALSQQDVKKLQLIGIKTNHSVIPNGYDRVRNVRRAPIPNLALCVTRFDLNKGLVTLVEAIKILRDSKVDVVLALVGPVTNQAYFKRVVCMITDYGLEDRVEVLGYVKEEKLTQLYETARVFVLPSDVETLPLTLCEAVSYGIPVVATNTGGIPSIIQDGLNGYLVEPRNPEELAMKIRRVMRQDFAIEQPLPLPTWEEVAKRTERIYRQLMRVP